VLVEALERVSGAPFVHVSVDLDVVDPDVAPGVGSPVRGGFSYREAHLMMELVAESGLSARWNWLRSTRYSITRTRLQAWP
jgi:arginase family enzyme